jgi:hypothetical protein
MRRHIWSVAAVIWLLAVAPAAFAAEGEAEPLSTDRPDITEASSVVGKGRFQLETSVYWERLRDGGVETRTVAFPTLLRLGVHPRCELRFESDLLFNERVSDPIAGPGRDSGTAPFDLGVKYALSAGNEVLRRPALGFIVHVGPPSGSGAQTVRRAGASLKLAADWELGPRLGLGANVGLAVGPDDNEDTVVSGILTGALGYSLNDRARAFVELAMQAPESRSGPAAIVFDTGMTYLLNPNAQVDFAIGTGLSGRTTPDLFLTVGFSRRF